MTPFTFLPRFITATSLVVLGLLSAACDPTNSTTPRSHCPPDAGDCGIVMTGGGSNSSGGGGSGGEGAGGSSASSDVQGSLGVLTTADFSQIAPYLGDATIFTTSASGTTIQAPYGSAAPTFDLPGVMTGSTWFFLRDETVGAGGIFSTHSVVNVPVAGSIMLPAIDRNVITSIAAGLPAPIVVDASKALLVIQVQRNGQPLSGVTVSSGISGGTIAYDNGVGLYTNQSTLTGPAGVILAINADGPTNAELRTVNLVDVNGQTFFVQLQVQAGAATFVGFAL